jgi:hypothetical protein
VICLDSSFIFFCPDPVSWLIRTFMFVACFFKSGRLLAYDYGAVPLLIEIDGTLAFLFIPP